MKILFLTNKPPYPLKDGGAIASFRLIEGMADTGNDVHLLTMNTNKHKLQLSDIPAEITQKIKFSLVDVPADVTAGAALKNLLFSSLPYNAERFISKDYESELIELLTKNQYDIVQLEGLYLSFYIPVIRKYSSAAIVYRAHNIEHEIWNRSLSNEKNIAKKTYLKILSKRLKRFELESLNQYDLLLPITQKDADFLAKEGNVKKSLVVPTGFDFSDSKISVSSNNTVLFHLGALDWFPNQEGLLWFFETVWNRILADFPHLKFHVAGRNAPQWFIDKLTLYKNVIFDGEVESAHDYMGKFQIMIVPLLSGSGMRIKIVEGMALGKTIVTTSIGSEGINSSHNKNIMIGDSENEFYESTISLLQDNQKCTDIGNSAFHFVSEELNNSTIINNLETFINENI